MPADFRSHWNRDQRNVLSTGAVGQPGHRAGRAATKMGQGIKVPRRKGHHFLHVSQGTSLYIAMQV